MFQVIYAWQNGHYDGLTGFEGSSLENTLATWAGDPRAKCATIIYCRANFSVFHNDIEQVDCSGELENYICNDDGVSNTYVGRLDFCQVGDDDDIITDPTTGEPLWEIVRCKEQTSYGCFDAVPTLINYTHAPPAPYQSPSGDTYYIKFALDTFINEDLINFGTLRYQGQTIPKGLGHTQNGSLFLDFVPGGYKVSKERQENKLFFIEDWDELRSLSVEELIPAQSYYIESEDGGYYWKKELWANQSIKIEHFSKQENGLVIGGQFTGNLILEGAMLAQAPSEASFLLNISSTGILVDNHVFKEPVTFSDTQNGTLLLLRKVENSHSKNILGQFDKLSSSYYILSEYTENGGLKYSSSLSLPLATIDEQMHLDMSADGQSYLLTYLVGNGYSKERYLHLDLLDRKGNVLWQNTIDAKSIDPEKFDFTFDKDNHVYAGVTTLRDVEVSTQTIRNAGGEDILLMKINGVTGQFEWVKSYATESDENVKKILLEDNILFFGGEYNTNIRERFLGGYRFISLKNVGRESYISYVNLHSLNVIDLKDEASSLSNVLPSSDMIGTRISKAYPNPFDNDINVEINSSQDELVDLAVFDILGNKVMTLRRNIVKGRNEILLDEWSELMKGVYTLIIFNNQGQPLDQEKLIYIPKD